MISTLLNVASQSAAASKSLTKEIVFMAVVVGGLSACLITRSEFIGECVRKVQSKIE